MLLSPQMIHLSTSSGQMSARQMRILQLPQKTWTRSKKMCEETMQVVKKTEAKYRLNFESVTDADSTVANQFMVATYPVSLVFHRGKVIFVSKKIHNFMEESFLSTIESAIKAN